MRWFSVLFAGALVTSIGSGLTAFGLAAHMFRLTGTASSVAGVQLAAFAPILLLAPVAGTLADRLDRRLLMMLGDGGSLLGLAVVLWAVSTPGSGTVPVFAGVALASCFAAFTEPALQASVSDVVGEDDYVRTAGMLQMAASSKFLVSPLLAGFLLPTIGIGGILVIDMATVFVTVGCSFAVHQALGHRRVVRSDGGLLSDLVAGWRLVAGTRPVVIAVGIVSLLTISLGVVQVLIKPILLPTHSVEAVGVVETVVAVGLLAGSGLVALWKRADPATLLGIGILGVAASMVVVGLRPEIVVVGTGGFLLFMSLSMCNAGASVVVRKEIPNELQGRAWGTIGLVSQVGFLVAYAVAGPLTDCVFDPLMAYDGAWASTVGRVIGVGDGRGAALVVILFGLAALPLAPLAGKLRSAMSQRREAGAEALQG